MGIALKYSLVTSSFITICPQIIGDTGVVPLNTHVTWSTWLYREETLGIVADNTNLEETKGVVSNICLGEEITALTKMDVSDSISVGSFVSISFEQRNQQEIQGVLFLTNLVGLYSTAS